MIREALKIVDNGDDLLIKRHVQLQRAGGDAQSWSLSTSTSPSALASLPASLPVSSSLSFSVALRQSPQSDATSTLPDAPPFTKNVLPHLAHSSCGSPVW